MTPTTLGLLGYCGWFLSLTVLLTVYRSTLVLLKKKKANTFKPDGSDISAFSERLCRTHANCYENLPIAAALLLFAIATGQTMVTDPLSLWFLGARVLQSLVHLISTSVPAVLIRFVFFAVQLVILFHWIWQFIAGYIN